MGTQPSPTAQLVMPRSRQKLKTDFYRVTELKGGPNNFRDALRELMRKRGRNRQTLLRQGRFDLHHCYEKNSIIEGDFGRVRQYDIPDIALPDATTRAIELQTGEGVTERTAFLFDSSTGVLALHARQGGVSASSIAGILDLYAGPPSEFFEFAIILNPDARARYQRMTEIDSVAVSYTTEARSTIAKPDETTENFLQGLERIGGGKIDIIIHAPKDVMGLVSSMARQFIGKADTARDRGVNKLRITGKHNGDRVLAVDLIEDRLRIESTIEVRGTSASYEQRRAVVRQSYESNRSILG